MLTSGRCRAMYALLSYAVHQLRSLPQRLSPRQARMTPSRHNRDLRHHTITPEYPINKHRMSATVFDISRTQNSQLAGPIPTTNRQIRRDAADSLGTEGNSLTRLVALSDQLPTVPHDKLSTAIGDKCLDLPV